MTAPSMEDWFGINNVFIRYANSLDRGDVEAVVECFSEDASLESPVLGKFSGHAGVRDFAARTATSPEGMRLAAASMRPSASSAVELAEGPPPV